MMNYINKVEESSGSKPSSSGDFANPLLDETPVRKIVDTYRDHPSVIAVKSELHKMASLIYCMQLL